MVYSRSARISRAGCEGKQMTTAAAVVAVQALYKSRVMSIEKENARWKAEIERRFASNPGLMADQLALLDDLRVLSIQIAAEEKDKALDNLVTRTM